MWSETIKQVLMRRDSMTSAEAKDLISEASANFHDRLAEGEAPFDICAE